MSKSRKENVIHLLWTSGWDSTYRMVELSRMPVTVQPVYITGAGRPSEQFEIDAQNKILGALRSRRETVAEILPVKYVEFRSIDPVPAVSDAYAVIHKETGLGTQYEWLAWYACQNPGIEIGSEGGPPEKLHMTEAIEKYGGLRRENGVFVLDKDRATPEGAAVLGNYTFPIIDKTEAEMRRNIREWGYEDVMANIWFCHNPIHGTPCGLCRACEVKMENDMEFLLPEKARKRYRLRAGMAKRIGFRAANHICEKIYR